MPLNMKLLNAQFYTDHLLDKNKSLECNMESWIYTTGEFIEAYTYTNNSEVGHKIRRLADDVGILDRFRSYLAPEIMVKHTAFQDQLKRSRIELTHSEVEWSNHNHTMKGDIGYMKKSVWQNMVFKKVLCAFGVMAYSIRLEY